MSASAESVAESTLASYRGRLDEMILDTGWFFTQDEHRGDAIYPFPNDKPGLRVLIKTLQLERLIVLPKSRQMTVTWTILAYLLSQWLMHTYELTIAQTKREDDVEKLMGRTRFMYDHFPPWLKQIRPKKSGARENSCKLQRLDANGKIVNEIWGIPQGADVIRSNTVTRYFGDEVDFQPDAKESLRAVGPSLGETGQGIFVSTVELGGLMGQMIKGEW